MKRTPVQYTLPAARTLTLLIYSKWVAELNTRTHCFWLTDGSLCVRKPIWFSTETPRHLLPPPLRPPLHFVPSAVVSFRFPLLVFKYSPRLSLVTFQISLLSVDMFNGTPGSCLLFCGNYTSLKILRIFNALHVFLVFCWGGFKQQKSTFNL